MLAAPDLDLVYMREALRLAEAAASRGDVPVGAIVVQDGRVTGTGFNTREAAADPTGHAEIVALREACRRADRWRVDGATLYVTLEPCPMCAGALVNARVARLVYAAADPKAGAARSLFSLCDDPRLNHRMQVHAGVLAEPCAAVLQRFFRDARSRGRRDLSPGTGPAPDLSPGTGAGPDLSPGTGPAPAPDLSSGTGPVPAPDLSPGTGPVPAANLSSGTGATEVPT